MPSRDVRHPSRVRLPRAVLRQCHACYATKRKRGGCAARCPPKRDSLYVRNAVGWPVPVLAVPGGCECRVVWQPFARSQRKQRCSGKAEGR